MQSKADPQLVFLMSINLLVLLSASLLSKGAFIDPYNLQSMASQLPELGLLAIGVMLAMCSGNGGIDLSGIALANVSGVFSATVVNAWIDVNEAPQLFTLAFACLAICTGLVGGVVNGLLISRLGLRRFCVLWGPNCCSPVWPWCCPVAPRYVWEVRIC